MKKIRFSLEYGGYPVWTVEDELDTEVGFPDDFHCDEVLTALLDEIQDTFESLYINDEQAFEYMGFSSEHDKERFMRRCRDAIARIVVANAGRYPFENRLYKELPYL